MIAFSMARVPTRSPGYPGRVMHLKSSAASVTLVAYKRQGLRQYMSHQINDGSPMDSLANFSILQLLAALARAWSTAAGDEIRAELKARGYPHETGAKHGE